MMCSVTSSNRSRWSTSRAGAGVVSIITGNANAMAVRPALERRWDDALASFDARSATAAVELEASRRDPYRRLSRVFHLAGRKRTSWPANGGKPPGPVGAAIRQGHFVIRVRPGYAGTYASGFRAESILCRVTLRWIVGQGIRDRSAFGVHVPVVLGAVSYTHLTLPTIYSV